MRSVVTFIFVENIEMSYSQIPHQHYFFYRGKWTAEMDSFLLSMLTYDKKRAAWVNNEIPSVLMQVIELEMKKKLCVAITMDEILQKKKALENRYWTFKQVVRVKGMHWDMQQHRVSTYEDSLWGKIFEVINLFFYHYLIMLMNWILLDYIL